MLQKIKWSWIITIFTFAAGVISYFQIAPDVQIPIHWNIYGEVDGTASPLIGLFVIPLAQALFLIFIAILKFIEPRKKNVEQSMPAISTMMAWLVIVMVLIQAMIISGAFGFHIMGPKVVFAVMGLMFIIAGNYMTKIRSGFFVGIRTPWTLSSDHVWKKSHRLGGRLLMIAGFIIFGAGLFYNGITMSVIILATILPATLIPVVYSWIIWRREKDKENQQTS